VILETDSTVEQFELLEGKIGRLLEICKALEVDKNELTNKIKRLEEELQGKVEAENRSREERDLIRSKVDNLLVKLDRFSEL